MQSKKFYVRQNLDVKFDISMRLVGMTDVEEVIAPPRFGTFYPITHSDIVVQVIDRILERGLVIRQCVHSMSTDTSRYSGVIEVGSRNVSSDYSWIVAIFNDIDSQEARLSVGCRLFATNVISFTGEVTKKIKHSKTELENLPATIDETVESIWSNWNAISDRLTAYKEFPLVNEKADHFILSAFRAKVIDESDLAPLIRAYDKPIHESVSSRSAWSLYNAFLMRMNRLRLSQLEIASNKLTKLFDSLVDLKSIPSKHVQAELL